MKIAGISAVFPSNVVTNEEVIEILERESKKKYNYHLSIPREALLDKLNSTEIKTRRWLSKNESRIDLVSEAIDKALIDAGLNKKDIDLILYASVHKQFKEPGDSFFIAKALGFHDVECFDVLEACNSFIRASNIAQAYLQMEKYKNILVITSEFMVHDDEYISSFQIDNIKNLDYSFSTLTVGEGTTATIFTAGNNKWEQDIIGLPQYANFCFMAGSEISSNDKTEYGLNEQDFSINQFISYGLKLHKGVFDILIEMIQKRLEKRSLSEIVFPHTHSKVAWEKIGKGLKIDVPYYHIFENYGNLVSSSMPVGIYLAKKEGKLKRNMKASAWMAAAGMSLSITDFEF